ncbi:hypothetical protein ACFYM0_35950 [Streptomyces sp. NPDC006487]|uniref:hypothetical protein n=1 Tax=Streptomyces sp. NPDC006487 TaxID=3364748 RepID=UPI00367F80B4
MTSALPENPCPVPVPELPDGCPKACTPSIAILPPASHHELITGFIREKPMETITDLTLAKNDPELAPYYGLLERFGLTNAQEDLHQLQSLLPQNGSVYLIAAAANHPETVREAFQGMGWGAGVTWDDWGLQLFQHMFDGKPWTEYALRYHCPGVEDPSDPFGFLTQVWRTYGRDTINPIVLAGHLQWYHTDVLGLPGRHVVFTTFEQLISDPDMTQQLADFADKTVRPRDSKKSDREADWDELCEILKTAIKDSATPDTLSNYFKSHTSELTKTFLQAIKNEIGDDKYRGSGPHDWIIELAEWTITFADKSKPKLTIPPWLVGAFERNIDPGKVLEMESKGIQVAADYHNSNHPRDHFAGKSPKNSLAALTRPEYRDRLPAFITWLEKYQYNPAMIKMVNLLLNEGTKAFQDGKRSTWREIEALWVEFNTRKALKQNKEALSKSGNRSLRLSHGKTTVMVSDGAKSFRENVHSSYVDEITVDSESAQKLQASAVAFKAIVKESAAKLDAEIRDTLVKLVGEDADLKGLEHSQKLPESAIDKIVSDYRDGRPEDVPKAIEEIGRQIKDYVRYTVVVKEPEKYTEVTQGIINGLKKGQQKNTSFKNFWAIKPGQGFDSGYRGVNSRWSHKGFEYEIQFHTEVSLDAKEDKTHEIKARERKFKNEAKALARKAHENMKQAQRSNNDGDRDAAELWAIAAKEGRAAAQAELKKAKEEEDKQREIFYRILEQHGMPLNADKITS